MNRTRVLVEGLIAGAVGYVAVVLAVAALDVIGGRGLFQTPSLLGQILIGGFGEPAADAVAPGPVFAYNGLHLLVFLAIGMGVAWLVYEVELHPVLWYAAFFAMMSAVLVTFMALALVAEPYAELLPRGELIAANAVAAAAIGVYLHRAHPGLAKKILEHGDPEYEPD